MILRAEIEERADDDGDCPRHARLPLLVVDARRPRDLRFGRAPHDFLDGLRDETSNLPRILAVPRGLVVDGQDQLTEFHGHQGLGSHGFLPFCKKGASHPIPKGGGDALCIHKQQQQIAGQQFVRKEFSSLHREPHFALASSFKVN